jgi:hypothetical protein
MFLIRTISDKSGNVAPNFTAQTPAYQASIPNIIVLFNVSKNVLSECYRILKSYKYKITILTLNGVKSNSIS